MSSQQSADSATLTPPPSTQVPSSQRAKTRTPTPPVSHISTPPPTGETSNASHTGRIGGFATVLSPEELEVATPEELKGKVVELQVALQEAKMSAAHHKLQYQMLAQSSAAALERMSVEARMAQSENEVIHSADQARIAATPTAEEGIIPIQKDLYQDMCRQIQLLRDANINLEGETHQQQKIILQQEHEIASLSDKVSLMAERIRANRESLQKYRKPQLSSRPDQTPRSVYATPQRGHLHRAHQQSQPFAALLQASEMASQESARAGRKSHHRNAQSMSSLPNTPQRNHGMRGQPPFQTPQAQRQALHVPATAPQQRTSALRTPDIYSQPSLPVSQDGPPSDGTVSASEDGANDSEAETDIIENDEVPESQASMTASQMLRTSREQLDEKRESFKGRGMLDSGSNLRQTKLFGAIRKSNVERSEEGPPAKRARTSPGIGLGISHSRN
ncbi:hypothetical protein CKM354_000196400 [Cercospora kikuchii]|uniref:Uncharacterized protein n=1 Tax=Cercospora kikuchii TaxID=84275 RepID=A0A9P3CH67_9PEZI|nr:uncharacterized protein CKM354_000196400 [Cercospora kikuchii]GIZ38548.1 hypothetical protein CKM354_000196400 [Cercospora kikuchii]